jgi:predicted Rossmann fold flavoprotein
MKVAVIGAGPMGLVSSIAIKKFHPDFEVVLFEKNNDIGPRIKVSGNGRCNFNNVNVAVDKYNTDTIKDILECNEEVFKLLEETGFMHYADNEGRCYPISETSVTLLNVFKILLEKYKVEVRLEKEITNIEFEGKLISIYGEQFDRLVLGIGGISSYNDRLCYEKLMGSLPVKLTELTPSLAPLSTSSFPKGLENRRVKCEVSLLCKGRIVKREKGEVLFKNSGLSGIVIFNMTSYLSRLHLKDYKDYQISLNLLPNCSKEQVNELVKNKTNLHAVLLDQLASYIEESSYQVEMLTDLRFNIKGIYDFENSQVTSGGISLQDINKDLSLRRNPRIYVGGEEIDVDGECGGYNIAFAMCSGYYIGKNIK